MAEQKKYFNIAGRLVQGNVFEPQTTDMTGRPMTDLKGNPKIQYFMGVAVPKDSPEFPPLWSEVSGIATRDFPGGETQRKDFSWKIVDGDLLENATKEGFPGHWVFRFTSGYPVQAAADNGTRPILNKDEIKRGYYLRVFFTCSGNGNKQKPGIYLNQSVVLLIGYGPEISSGPDAAALAASVSGGYVPPGAQSQPVGGYGQPPASGPAPGGYGQQPASGPAPGGYGQQPVPSADIPPHHGILNQ